MGNDQTSNGYVQPFHRLQSQLATLLASMNSGERLPAEPELAKQLGVSRATLREAMRAFEGQGLIRRRQGVGTFVVGHPSVIDTGLEVLESIESLAKKIQLDVSMGALQISRIPADAKEAERMAVEEGSPLVRISRVILTKGRPVAYLIDLLPEDILTPDELREGFTGSVLDFLLKRGEPQLNISESEINAISAPSEIARLLEIQRSDVLLLFTGKLFALTGRMIDYSQSYFLPGYFHFHVLRRVESQR